MKLVRRPLMGGLLHLVQRGGDWAGRDWAGRILHRPLLAVPNVTAHSSTSNALITVLLYNVPLLCSFSVAIKGLITTRYLSLECCTMTRTDFCHFIHFTFLYSRCDYVNLIFKRIL